MRMRPSGSGAALRLPSLLVLFTPLASGASITGICPDGSMFIVQSEDQIPCSAAKQVEPHEVPPIRPQYMPNPYTWQVYNELQDPNNPYNLIDSVRDIRAMQRGGGQQNPAPEETPDVSGAPPGWDDGSQHGAPGAGSGSSAPQATQLAAHQPVGPLDLGLADQELRDLYQIVELSQESTPAAFERRTADGRGVM